MVAVVVVVVDVDVVQSMAHVRASHTLDKQYSTAPSAALVLHV